MKYEIIIFDADETLFDFRKSESTAFENTMLEFDIAYDENHHLKIYQEINTAVWTEFEDGIITQDRLNSERFKRFSDKIETKFDEVKFADSYMKHLANASILYDDSLPLVESLNKNYRLAIVTNGLKDVQDGRVRKSIIANYFDNIVVSEEVKVAKPDPRIFEHAINNIRYTSKSKILMVGDSLTSDIQGGINFGIDTCWYNPEKLENKTGIKPTYEISNLMELKEIIEK